MISCQSVVEMSGTVGRRQGKAGLSAWNMCGVEGTEEAALWDRVPP